MSNPSLVTLRSRVRARINVADTDPRFPDQTVNRAIGMAVNALDSIRPNGWWFSRYEKDFHNTAGALDVLPVTLTDRTRSVQKIGYVFASLDGNYWIPVEQRERTDAISYADHRTAAAGIPASWSQVRVPVDTAQRNQLGLAFDTPLPDQCYVRVGMIVSAGRFTADADLMVWLMPPFVGAIIETAAATLARQKRAVGPIGRRRPSDQSVATLAAAAWVKALVAWFDTPYHGPGQAQVSM